ncbi:MAG: hypothetical protein A3D65_05195 [Candidatus Lloydbacteria bacterium RIFCSPHIGHO2_02_FULL_50_13]|uniref:Uncharacterized protein n=1 Tax=Candidatus Lloydbacteria bacterium RIFCSPHIGHO2_02_FULL_50_13 TaxID=1798661 RepID=A0A1G2D2H6_9BACT|nr:MAG: hypothetical protein A3D65_05195 [Candidatus Lloydbacteria bacterium RIFCSPHIGHO2_02_FULL_50_13]
MGKHFLFGAATGVLFALLFGLSPTQEASIWAVVVSDVVFGAILATVYYSLFRGIVIDPKRSPEMRTRFATTFFFLVGGLSALSVIMVSRGYSIVEAASLLFAVTACTTVAYRKLHKLYRATNAGGGAEPPKSQ